MFFSISRFVPFYCSAPHPCRALCLPAGLSSIFFPYSPPPDSFRPFFVQLPNLSRVISRRPCSSLNMSIFFRSFPLPPLAFPRRPCPSKHLDFARTFPSFPSYLMRKYCNFLVSSSLFRRFRHPVCFPGSGRLQLLSAIKSPPQPLICPPQSGYDECPNCKHHSFFFGTPLYDERLPCCLEPFDGGNFPFSFYFQGCFSSPFLPCFLVLEAFF